MYLTKFLIFSVRLLIFDVIGMALVTLCGQAYLRQMSINLKIYSHLNTLQLIALTSTSRRFDGGTSWDMYTAIVNSLFVSDLVELRDHRIISATCLGVFQVIFD